jgi:hypothetical protein
MPFYRVNGTVMHVKLAGPKSKHPKPCCARLATGERCCGISSFLCDWPVDGGTCDAPLCEAHAQAIGPDRHLCPLHAPRCDELPGQKGLF